MLPSLVVTVTFVINFYCALSIQSRQNRRKRGYFLLKDYNKDQQDAWLSSGIAILGFSDKYDSSLQNLSMIELSEGLGYTGSFHEQTSSGREKDLRTYSWPLTRM